MSLVTQRRGRAVSSGEIGLIGSMLFDGVDEYLELDPFSSVNPDLTKVTYMAWMRMQWPRAQNGSILQFSGETGSWNFYVRDFSDDHTDIVVIESVDGGSTNDSVEGNAGLPDRAAGADIWLHVGFTFDQSLGDQDRLRIWVDNVSDVNLSPWQFTRSVLTWPFSNGSRLRVGSSATWRFFGHLADPILIEGQALTPTQVNYDSADGGKWKNYEGGFGAHGFRLNPQKASDLGRDLSGNGNHFTPVSMDASNFDPNQLPPQ